MKNMRLFGSVKNMKIPCLIIFMLGIQATDLLATNAATCSRADVNRAIRAADSTDHIVVVPAGATCDWSAGISISGIRLIGGGSSMSGTVITTGLVTMTKHASRHTELKGFRFTHKTEQHVLVNGKPFDEAYIIDNNYFLTSGGAGSSFVRLTVNGGLLHHNAFVMSPSSTADVFSIQTGEAWTEGATIGSNDTTGERNIYFEDNTFDGFSEAAPDGDQRARLVIRHNTFIDSSIVFHGGFSSTAGYSDTTPGGGVRHFEIYNNTFVRVSNSVPVNKWIWVRGSTGVIANNSMDRASSPDGFSYPNKSEIRLSLNCNGGKYPVEFQVGQITATTDSTPNFPLLIFGNTAGPNSNGPADSIFITVGRTGSGSFDCASPNNPATYIQLDRDYRLTNFWNWTPYTYPHPLQGGGTASNGSNDATSTAGSQTAASPVGFTDNKSAK